jgi:hypothetical protein
MGHTFVSILSRPLRAGVCDGDGGLGYSIHRIAYCPAALSFDGYFDFENGTAEIVKLADWDTVKSNVFAKTAIQFVQGLPAGRLPKKVVVLVCYL